MIPYQSERFPTVMRQVKSWDGAAMVGSLFCAIHCLIQPVLLTSLPLLGWVTGSAAFEMGSMTLTLLISCYALISGYQIHRRIFPLATALAAASILMGSALMHSEHSSDSHDGIAIWGACLVLLLTHLANLRLLKASIPKIPEQTGPRQSFRP